MRQISKRVSDELAKTPELCERALLLKDHVCKGRPATREHVWIYAGNQVDEAWAIIKLCSYAHSVDQFQDGGILNKEINQWISINKMTPEDEMKYKKFNWGQRRRYLNQKYKKATD